MFDYSVKFSAVDKISEVVDKINQKMAQVGNKASQASSQLNNKVNEIRTNAGKVELSMDTKRALVRLRQVDNRINSLKTNMQNVGQKGEQTFLKSRGAIAGAVGFLAPLGQALGAYQDIERAKGEIRSLGIDDAGIKSIAKSAMDFSNTWAGTTTADFIRASYDIKSGIATLSDADVGKFTALAGMTATATKASTAEMTKLFALGHGIFREQFTSDLEFGEQFSSAISTAVQAFRTDGADLVSGLSTLGANATAMGVSLQEQLAVLGMSKSAFNSASEGATSYRAFLNGAIKAQDKLGLTFTDSTGKLLPMADIMDKIRNKVQSTGLSMQDASVQQALKEAFGDEAIKMISALINKSDDLRKSQRMLYDNMMQGTKVTEEMAKAMQQGKEFELLQQKVQNAGAVIGGMFAPYALRVAGIVGEVTDKIKAWVEANPELTSTIVKWISIIGGVLAVLATLSIVIGVVGMSIGSLSAILTGLSFVIKAVQIATLIFNATLWANPITWIIAGVVALIGAIVALIYYWQDITNWVGQLWDKFTGFVASLNIVENAIGSVRAVFETLTAPIRYVNELIDSFLSKFEILYNKAKAKVQDIAGAIENQASNAWENTKSFFGFGNDTQAQDATQIDNTNKNHTVVDVNIQATGGVVTEQNAQSNGGRVKLNTASNGV